MIHAWYKFFVVLFCLRNNYAIENSYRRSFSCLKAFCQFYYFLNIGNIGIFIFFMEVRREGITVLDITGQAGEEGLKMNPFPNPPPPSRRTSFVNGSLCA